MTRVRLGKAEQRRSKEKERVGGGERERMTNDKGNIPDKQKQEINFLLVLVGGELTPPFLRLTAFRK